MNFGVPTQNRFQIFEAREEREQREQRAERRNGNMEISRQTFLNSDLDNKLLLMFDELKVIRNEQVICTRGLASFEKSLTGIGEKLGQVIHTTNAQSEFLRTLAYKSIDIEARSRRNNLIFRGFSENRGENCFELIRDFLLNHLDIDPSRMYLARAHRLGKFDRNRQFQRRPIIVNFRDFCDIDLIMSRVTMLRGSAFSIDYDYPKEIQEARSRLWPIYKQRKHDNPDAKLQIVYPAKLICNGKLVKDELPDWPKYTSTSRLTQLERISSDTSVSTENTVGHHQELIEHRSDPQACVTSEVAREVQHRDQTVAMESQSDLPMHHSSIGIAPAHISTPNTQQSPPNVYPAVNNLPNVCMNFAPRPSFGPQFVPMATCNTPQPQQQMNTVPNFVSHVSPAVGSPLSAHPFLVLQNTSFQQPSQIIPDMNNLTGAQFTSNTTACVAEKVNNDTCVSHSDKNATCVLNEKAHENHVGTCTPPLDTQNTPVSQSSQCVEANYEIENTVPKRVSSPVRGRSRSRKTISREKRSDSVHPYSRNTSTTRTRSHSVRQNESRHSAQINNSQRVLPETKNSHGGQVTANQSGVPRRTVQTLMNMTIRLENRRSR